MKGKGHLHDVIVCATGHPKKTRCPLWTCLLGSLGSVLVRQVIDCPSKEHCRERCGMASLPPGTMPIGLNAAGQGDQTQSWHCATHPAHHWPTAPTSPYWAPLAYLMAPPLCPPELSAQVSCASFQVFLDCSPVAISRLRTCHKCSLSRSQEMHFSNLRVDMFLDSGFVLFPAFLSWKTIALRVDSRFTC